jgi:hypothetical protein
VNVICTFLLARYCWQGGSLTRAAFLSARNDVIGNVAIIAAGLATQFLWRTRCGRRRVRNIVGLRHRVFVMGAMRALWV